MNTYSQFNGRSLNFGTLNVCGLKKRLDYPEFLTTISSYDILCIAETKLDSTDVISVPGYTFYPSTGSKRFIGNLAVLVFCLKIVYPINLNC